MLVAQLVPIGTFIEALLFFVTASILYRLSRGGAGSAVSELSKSNEFLTKKVNEQGAEIRDLKVENAQLSSKSNYAEYLAQAMEPVLRYMVDHEERAEGRQAAIIEVFRLLGDRLHGHDVTMKELAVGQSTVFAEMVGLLQEIREAGTKNTQSNQG